MLLMILLILMLTIALVVGLVVIGVGGVVFAMPLADLLICILILVSLIKFIFGKTKKNKVVAEVTEKEETKNGSSN